MAQFFVDTCSKCVANRKKLVGIVSRFVDIILEFVGNPLVVDKSSIFVEMERKCVANL